MNKVMYIVLTIMLCVLSFILGTVLKQNILDSKSVYKLKDEVVVQHSPNSIGKLPKGTTVYEYDAKGETITYLVFFNFKNQEVLEKTNHDKSNTIAPLDGYLE